MACRAERALRALASADDRIAEAQDDAVRRALRDQEEAGIDIVTDGEQRRRHYISGFLAGLTGIDVERLGRRMSRGGRYARETNAARIVGEVTRPRAVLLHAVRFAKARTSHPLKVTLPGPLTIVDGVVEEHYRTTNERSPFGSRSCSIRKRESWQRPAPT